MKMVLQLLHGRGNPFEDVNGWGEEGPAFRIKWFHCTYLAIYNFQFEGLNCEVEFSGTFKNYPTKEPVVNFIYDEMIYYDGMFYGDWEIHPETEFSNPIPFDPNKGLTQEIIRKWDQVKTEMNIKED